MLLDMHIADHASAILRLIKEKAYLEFVRPFTSLDLMKMGTVFNSDPAALEDDLCELIMKGRIAARIDSKNKVFQKYTVCSLTMAIPDSAFKEARRADRSPEEDE